MTHEDRLQQMIADLDGYIERRAAELAAPLIEAAQEEARDKVGRAEAKAVRQEDLIVELRRQLAAQVRWVERLHAEQVAAVRA